MRSALGPRGEIPLLVALTFVAFGFYGDPFELDRLLSRTYKRTIRPCDEIGTFAPKTRLGRSYSGRALLSLNRPADPSLARQRLPIQAGVQLLQYWVAIASSGFEALPIQDLHSAALIFD